MYEYTALASDHAAQVEQFVSKQKAIVECLKVAGKDTLEAEQAFALFDASLKIFQEHRNSPAYEATCGLTARGAMASSTVRPCGVGTSLPCTLAG